MAGTVDTKTTSVGTLDTSGIVDPGRGPGVSEPAATGSQNCRTTTRQDYAGFQVGHDFSILNKGANETNLHWGVTAGYLETKTKDVTPAGTYTSTTGLPFLTPAGSFSDEPQVPFVGLYTVFSKGNLALDGQARWDFYESNLTDASNGLSGQRLTARGFTLTGNASYYVPFASGWFLEPSGGVVWSRVKIDPLNVSGVPTYFQSGLPTGATLGGGTVTVDEIESILGRATLRFGTNISAGLLLWQPFFAASVFHEFAGDVTARALADGNIAPFGQTDEGQLNQGINGALLTTKSEGGVGTYGQFALGTVALLGNTGWLGYGRIDYRVGEAIEGWGINAGLRYHFSPNPMGDRAASAQIHHTHNWSGPYMGIYSGVVWGTEHWAFKSDLPAGLEYSSGGGSDSPQFSGAAAGLQLGYNFQRADIVVGIEGEYGVSNARGGVACPFQHIVAPGHHGPPDPLFFLTCEAESKQLAMLTGRLGLSSGRALFYAKGGLAVGEVGAGTSLNAVRMPTTVPFGSYSGFTLPASTTNWQVGWTLGAGMEFALSDRWSAKAEYMYYDLGEDAFATFRTDPRHPCCTNVYTSGDSVRVGLNFHLSPVEHEGAK